MSFLLVQCLRGNGIGKIKIEQMNMNKDYYYYYEPEGFNNENIENEGKILFVQYENKEAVVGKKCCGMAIGKYKLDNANKLLQVNVNQIEFGKNEPENTDVVIEESDEYKEIIKCINEIKPESLASNNSNIININYLEQSQIKGIEGIGGKKIDTEKALKAIKKLYEEYELKTNLSKYDSDEEKEKEEVKEIFKVYDNNKLKNIFKSYDKLESNLDDLAQKSINSRRVINKGKRRANRTEYQRDWERIIHSKSFRRLEDKAQIYTLSKGDHFRTRLTHTLEVTQIARGISRELNLNEDLVEAIALGHDLGHTPFGHVGERTLNEILKNEGVEGGFKHNFQGVKVVNYLEEKYGEFEGIDLTYQVMEGILKHTKISECKNCSEYDKTEKTCTMGNLISALNCDKNPYRIENFLCKGDIENLHPEYKFATTLEGQVVAVADEIAQRAHDLDDGIASGIINEDKFIKKLESEEIFRELYEDIKKSLDYINEYKREYIDPSDIKRARIVSDIITYFIRKIVQVSQKNIEYYKRENSITKDNFQIDGVIKCELISFKCIDKVLEDTNYKIDDVRKSLEEITSDEIINSEEVNCFDGKGEYIIRKLYKAYITNPRQMSKTTIKRIEREVSKYTNKEVDIKKIYIKDGDNKKKNENEEVEFKSELEELDIIKHKIFVRCIIDLIAGMTDEFANKQFEKLYAPGTY